MRAGIEEAEEVLTIGKEQIGYAQVTRRRHDKKPTGKLAHRWWYRCLERAGLVSEGTTSGMTCTGGATRPRRSSSALTMTCALPSCCSAMRTFVRRPDMRTWIPPT